MKNTVKQGVFVKYNVSRKETDVGIRDNAGNVDNASGKN